MNDGGEQQLGASEENGMLEAVKLREFMKYGRWKRRGGCVVFATIERGQPGTEDETDAG